MCSFLFLIEDKSGVWSLMQFPLDAHTNTHTHPTSPYYTILYICNHLCGLCVFWYIYIYNYNMCIIFIFTHIYIYVYIYIHTFLKTHIYIFFIYLFTRYVYVYLRGMYICIYDYIICIYMYQFCPALDFPKGCLVSRVIQKCHRFDSSPSGVPTTLLMASRCLTWTTDLSSKRLQTSKLPCPVLQILKPWASINGIQRRTNGIQWP